MGWRIFDADTENYEAWYASPRGRYVDQAERELLDDLLSRLPEAATILEIGCGTGHFTAALARQGRCVIGLERAPEMLATMRRLHPALPVVLGDAHKLPFRDGAVDVAGFITALEFLDRPEVALAEAVRVSRRGLMLVALNTWSVGGYSRRWGRQARGHRLGRACDYSLPRLVKLVRAATSDRLQDLWWTSALFPGAPTRFLARVPLGDVIGLAVTLRSTKTE
jgi:ubiquinone/menaquinone biosynthesis C-methylase UbiE